jgi:curli production assembly/transport component CsgE
MGAFMSLVVVIEVYAADPEFQSKAEALVERAEKFATETAERDVQSETEIELEGIVVNRTRTPVGRRFYQEFSADWIENLDRQSGRANLLIQERPARGSGSLMTISDEQDVLYSQFLTPRIVGIKESAEKAAEIVRERLVSKAIARLNESQTGGDLFGEGY